MDTRDQVPEVIKYVSRIFGCFFLLLMKMGKLVTQILMKIGELDIQIIQIEILIYILVVMGVGCGMTLAGIISIHLNL